MNVELYVCKEETDELKAIRAFLRFEGIHYRVHQDVARVMQLMKGCCNPQSGACVVCDGVPVGGFWGLMKYFQTNGLVRI